jgi:hypothetical protein
MLLVVNVVVLLLVTEESSGLGKILLLVVFVGWAPCGDDGQWGSLWQGDVVFAVAVFLGGGGSYHQRLLLLLVVFLVRGRDG